jgi:hypothetical protein
MFKPSIPPPFFASHIIFFLSKMHVFVLERNTPYITLISYGSKYKTRFISTIYKNKIRNHETTSDQCTEHLDQIASC